MEVSLLDFLKSGNSLKGFFSLLWGHFHSLFIIESNRNENCHKLG